MFGGEGVLTTTRQYYNIVVGEKQKEEETEREKIKE